MGVSSGLASFETALLTFGVLGPAGASGTCTVFPFVDGFAGSGTGTGVLTLGEGTTEAVRSRGVDTVELGVGIGEATELGAGAMSCRRARLGSGGLDALSCVATDASLVVSMAPSVVGGGDASRFRLFDSLSGVFFF